MVIFPFQAKNFRSRWAEEERGHHVVDRRDIIPPPGLALASHGSLAICLLLRCVLLQKDLQVPKGTICLTSSGKLSK